MGGEGRGKGEGLGRKGRGGEGKGGGRREGEVAPPFFKFLDPPLFNIIVTLKCWSQVTQCIENDII